MDKPLLLTMTQNRFDDVSKMISNIYPTFDGIVGLVNLPCNDGTLELLKKNKGNGKIITQNFTPNHAFLMNHLLFYGNIKDGQYCVYLDSPESMTDKFIETLSNRLHYMEEHKCDALYWDNRPYIFKYNSYLEFFGAVHWGLNGIKGKIISSPDKEDYIINRRLLNKSISWCLNGSKYYICYPLSNDVFSTYQKYGDIIVFNKENERRKIRSYFEKKLKLNLNTLDDLINYMKKVECKEIIPHEFFINALENNFRLSELYQLKVLNMDFENIIAKKRHCWSFRAHLLNGNGWVEGYVGEINKLNKQYNLPLE